jgi:hypothetical protein
VYVFNRTDGGWRQTSKLVAKDAMTGDALGYSVAVQGDTIVAGAYRDDSAGSDTGSVYVFNRSGTKWSQTQELTPYDAIASEWFGWSVALDADTLVVGAWYDTHGADKEGPFGSAYEFTRTGASWNTARKLVAQTPNPFDLFGWAVGVRGGLIAVGARLDDGAAVEGGAVYVLGSQ